MSLKGWSFFQAWFDFHEIQEMLWFGVMFLRSRSAHPGSEEERKAQVGHEGDWQGLCIFWFCFYFLFSFWALSRTGIAVWGTGEDCWQSCSWSSPKWQPVLLIPSFPESVGLCKSWKCSEDYQASPFWGVLAVQRGISRFKTGMNWVRFKTLAKYLSIHGCLRGPFAERLFWCTSSAGRSGILKELAQKHFVK